MIPLPVILAEFIMALGGALFVANMVALVRARRERAAQGDEQKPVPRGRAVTNMLIGLVVFSWGLATFLVRLKTKT